MLVPVGTPTPPASTENEYRSLATALKLLSGDGCKRDPSQAQVLLLNLSQSARRDVAEDAQRVMQAALIRGWLDDTVPKPYELEALAKRSLARAGRNPNQKLLLVLFLLVGVMVFLTGLLAFAGSTAESFEIPWVAVALVIGVLALIPAAFLKNR